MTPETIDFYNTFVAMLALVALVGSLALVVYRLAAKSKPDLGVAGMWLAWVVALVATAGSLIYSELIHFVPCRLCWFQRIAMYPLAVVLLVGAVRKELAAKFYALPLALGGLAISVWHYLVQVYPSLEGSACDPTNPCSARYVEVFGFISIPFMAGAGSTLIATLLLLYVKAPRR